MNEEWDAEDVPDDFWCFIAAANGDEEKFRQFISAFTGSKLKEMYWQYCSLVYQLFGEEHVQKLQDHFSEDGLEDLACWVVMQGKDVYFSVFHDPDCRPWVGQRTRCRFRTAIIETYSDRFGKPISF